MDVSEFLDSRSGQVGSFLLPGGGLLPDDGRAAPRQLVSRHERCAPLFGRTEPRPQALIYRNGLLLATGRKSAAPLALALAQPQADTISPNQVVGLQRFLTYSPWDYQDIQREIQAVVADQLVPATATWALGTVGVVAGAGLVKKGTHRVGVQRPYCGRVGKKENGQGGVFLVGVPPAGPALLDHQLYLPKDWAKDRQRRQATSVPKALRFRTAPPIGAALIRRTHEPGGVHFDWLTAAAHYGPNGQFLDLVAAQPQRYLVAVPVNTTVWTEDPAPAVAPYGGQGRPPSRAERRAVQAVTAVAAALPAAAWQTLPLREGATGPLVFEFAAVRVGAGRCGSAVPDHRLGWWCGARWRRRRRASTTSAMPTRTPLWRRWRW